MPTYSQICASCLYNKNKCQRTAKFVLLVIKDKNKCLPTLKFVSRVFTIKINASHLLPNLYLIRLKPLTIKINANLLPNLYLIRLKPLTITINADLLPNLYLIMLKPLTITINATYCQIDTSFGSSLYQ